jgi:hypothetical protein
MGMPSGQRVTGSRAFGDTFTGLRGRLLSRPGSRPGSRVGRGVADGTRASYAHDAAVPLVDDDLDGRTGCEVAGLGDDVDTRAIDLGGASRTQVGQRHAVGADEPVPMRSSDIGREHESVPSSTQPCAALGLRSRSPTEEHEQPDEQTDGGEERESGDVEGRDEGGPRHDLDVTVDHRERRSTEQREHTGHADDADPWQHEHLHEDEDDAEDDEQDRLDTGEPGEQVPEQEQPDRGRTERRPETDATAAQHVTDEQPDTDGEQQSGDQSAGQHTDETFSERWFDVDARVAVEVQCDQQRFEVDGDPVCVAALSGLRDVHGEQLPTADEPLDDDRRVDHGLGDGRVTTALARGGPEHGTDRGDRLLVRGGAVPLDRCRCSDDGARSEPQLLGCDRDERSGAEGVPVDERDGRDPAPEQHVPHPQDRIETPARRVDAHDERCSAIGLGLTDGAFEERRDAEIDLPIDDDDVHGRKGLRALRSCGSRRDDEAERPEAEQCAGSSTPHQERPLRGRPTTRTARRTAVLSGSGHGRRVRGPDDAGAGRR